MNVAQAYVQILPQTEDFTSDLKGQLDSAGTEAGESAGKKAGGGFASALGKAAKIGSVAIGAAAAGVTALGAGFVKATTDAAAMGDEIDKQSQKLGISAKAYQEWDAVLKHSGTSMSAAKTAIRTLANQAEQGSEAFQALGISQEQVRTMSREDLFNATITGLQNVTNENERATLATQLLGRSAIEMGALLNTSAEDTQALKDRVHELGGVMDDTAVKSAAAFQDQLQDMKTAAAGAVRNLAAQFLPSLTQVMSGMTEIFSGNTDQGVELVGDGIKKVIAELVKKLPEIIKVVGSILNALLQALIENLPAIVEAGAQLLMMLVQGIIDNLPKLVEAAIQCIVMLAKGLAEALPKLIPAIVECILTIVDTLIDNLPLLVDAALQLMIGLATGLVEAIPVIIEKLPEIIRSIVDALVKSAPKIAEAGVKLFSALVDGLAQIGGLIGNAISDLLQNIVNWISNGWSRMVEAGRNLILGIGEGIQRGAQYVLDCVANLGNAIVNGIKSFFGIASPSKLMEGLGEFLPQGFAIGIESGNSTVKKAIGGMSDNAMIAAAEPLVSSAPELPVGTAANRDTGNITVILELDGIQFAKAVYKYNRDETQRIGLRLAGGMA